MIGEQRSWRGAPLVRRTFLVPVEDSVAEVFVAWLLPGEKSSPVFNERGKAFRRFREANEQTSGDRLHARLISGHVLTRHIDVHVCMGPCLIHAHPASVFCG